MRFNIAALIFLAQFAHATGSTCSDCTADAQSIAVQISTVGSNCNFSNSVSRQRGYRCQTKITGYSMPVDIFIAPSFQKNQPMALAYHLHGFWTDPSSTPFDGADGDFGTFVASSNKNLILVVPESLGKNATYAAELGTARKMTAFFTHVESMLSKAGVPVNIHTPRLLSGHSGAYVQLGLMGDWATAHSVPHLQTLRGIGLFDTAYGYRAGLAAFMDVMCPNPSATYFMAFNPSDGSTGKRDANARILSELKTTHLCPHAQVIYTPDASANHVTFPRKYMSAFFTDSLTTL